MKTFMYSVSYKSKPYSTHVMKSYIHAAGSVDHDTRFSCNNFFLLLIVIPGIVTINGETLTSLSPHYDANVSPMTITWPPLSQQNGGKYLLQYLIQINATQLSGNRKLNLSEIEEKTTNTSILFYNIKPFTLYAIQVFAELNNTITTSSDNTILQVTVPTVLQTQESGQYNNYSGTCT